jgi:hypothetical protein
MNGLVLALDAGNTKSYPGTGTTWYDLSGRGNTGTLTNGPTYSSANGGSIVFDRADDYVTVPRNSSLIPTGNWSYECWFNLTSTTDPSFGQSFFGNWGNSSTGDFDIRKSGNTMIFYCYDSGNGLISTITASYVFTAQKWEHFVLTRESNTYNFYFNNQLVGSVTNTNPVFDGSANMTIGIESGVFSNFNGRMSSIKVYNRALSAAEVSQNFNALRGRFGI